MVGVIELESDYIQGALIFGHEVISTVLVLHD